MRMMDVVVVVIGVQIDKQVVVLELVQNCLIAELDLEMIQIAVVVAKEMAEKRINIS